MDDCPISLDCQYFPFVESFSSPGETRCSNLPHCEELAEPLCLPYRYADGVRFMTVVTSPDWYPENTLEDLNKAGWKSAEDYFPPLTKYSTGGFHVSLSGCMSRKREIWLRLQKYAEAVSLPYVYRFDSGLEIPRLDVYFDKRNPDYQEIKGYGFGNALRLPYHAYYLEDKTRITEVVGIKYSRHSIERRFFMMGYASPCDWDSFSEIKKLKDGCNYIEVSRTNDYRENKLFPAESIPYRATYKRKDKYFKLTVLRKEGGFLPATDRTPWKFRGLICYSYVNRDCIPENLCFKKDLKALNLTLSPEQQPRAYYHSFPYHQKIPLWDKNECA